MGGRTGNTRGLTVAAMALMLASCTSGAAGLRGTSWRLEDLAGAGVLDRVQATLEFTEEGRASGSASCNRFNGAVTVSGASITFGPLATTRRMCADAVMDQETRYLAALHEAERFEIDEPFLYIHTTGRPQPLRLIRADDDAPPDAASDEPAASGATDTSDWHAFRDFRASGTEPFWGLEIKPGQEIRFTRVGERDVVTPIPAPATDATTAATTYHAVTEANDLRVVIEPTRCTDSMNGHSFAATVTVILNGQAYHGCGG